MRTAASRATTDGSAWLISAALVVGDQIIKQLVSRLDQPIGFAGVSIEQVVNDSGVFGLKVGNAVLIGIGVLVCAGLLAILIAGAQQPSTRTGLWLILGGAASNIFDRVVAGGVIDVVALWDFPRFNLADVMIILGALSILLGVVIRPRYGAGE